MTISSSLNAGVAGLAANASRLAAISDNIANSGTHGYKRAEADFHSMVISSGSGTYSAGGVRVTTQRLIDQPGALVATNNATDLAVRGRGFLPVASASALKAGGETPMLLASTGSFRTDDEGLLRTDTGLVLMGWPASADGSVPPYPRDTGAGLQPIQISANQFAGEPTTEMTLSVNLPATSTEADETAESEILSVEYFDNLGTSQNLEVSYIPVPPAEPGLPATNQWHMIIRDSAKADETVGAYTLQFNGDRVHGGTLQNVEKLEIDGNGDPSVGSGVYADGTSWDPDEGDLTIYVGAATPPQNPLNITMGAKNSTNGITQLSDSFAPTSILKDGSPVGNMVSVEVDANGFVHANFDTGITRKIYQIPLVDLPNPNGLISLDNQTYTTSNESGSFFLWDAADGPTGDIVSYALEESATDVAGELTNLIQTQRAYSSNAKVIQTVDEMLQETTNIKR